MLGADGLELLLGGADDLVDLAGPEGVLGDRGAVHLEGGHGADAAHAGELLWCKGGRGGGRDQGAAMEGEDGEEEEEQEEELCGDQVSRAAHVL